MALEPRDRQIKAPQRCLDGIPRTCECVEGQQAEPGAKTRLQWAGSERPGQTTDTAGRPGPQSRMGGSPWALGPSDRPAQQASWTEGLAFKPPCLH